MALGTRSAVLERVYPGVAEEADDGWIECRDATSGEHLGRLPKTSARELANVVAAARAATPSWRDAPRSRRFRVLASLLDEIVTAQDELGRLAAHESGKTMVQALLGDVLPACAAIDAAMRRTGWTRIVWPRSRSRGRAGIVGVLATDRFPLQGIVAPVAGALAEGRAAVVWLSKHAAWSGQMYVEIIRNVLRQHGHDPALVAGVTADPGTVAALLDAPLDRIVGAGPDEAARDLLTLAARSLTSVTWHRQGNEAMIVAEDADVARAVDAAVLASFTPLPPPVLAAERILVHARCHEEFVFSARRRVLRLRQGMPLDEDVDCGPVAPSVGVDHVAALVEDACRRGATTLVGGHTRGPLARTHYPPTLLVNVPSDARIVQEPTFGPVMAVMRVRSDDEAIALANAAPTGAGVSVFGGTPARSRALSRRLRASRVRLDPIGIAGSLLARAGRALLPDTSPYPAGPHTYATLESLLRLRYGQGLRQRARAVSELRSTRRISNR